LPEQLEDFSRNSGDYIYSRKFENVFFDGLTNKAITFTYDDLLQSKDIAGGTQTEAMELIRIINTEEYMAHMAHLENKGNVYIRPRYLLATTNKHQLDPKSIEMPEALRRRFNFTFVVTPKAEYTRTEDLGNDMWNRKFDYSKLPPSRYEDLAGTDLRPDFMDYTLCSTAPTPSGAGLTPITRMEFAEVLQLLKDRSAENQRRYELHKKNFDDCREKYKNIFKNFDNAFEEPTDEVMSYPLSDEEITSDNETLDSIDLKVYTTEYVASHNIFPLDKAIISDLYPKSNIDALLDEHGLKELMESIRENRDPRSYGHGIRLVRVANYIRTKVSNIMDFIYSKLPTFSSLTAFYQALNPWLEGTFLIIVSSALLYKIGGFIYEWWFNETLPQSTGYSKSLKQKEANKMMRDEAAIKALVGVKPQSADSSGIS